MTTKTGYDAWREKNLRLPFPDEFRTLPDGGARVIWNHLKKGWYEVYVEFSWGPDGAPLGGDGEEEAVGQPDYWSRSLGIPDERVLANVLADYA